MAEKPKPEGLKTMLKGPSSSDSANSVKDQVKQALLRNRANPVGNNQNQNQNPDAAGNISSNGFVGPSSQDTSGMNQAPNISPVVSKIEKTVDSINEVHTTMESLNRNMNMFVDLFNKRGASLGASSNVSESSGTVSSASNQSTHSSIDLDNGQNAVTTLLLTNLLKKGEDDQAERLKDLDRGTPEYLELLTKKLEKFQSEFELLQYLYEPKTITGNLQPTQDEQGNSAWLAGFMSMMLKRK